VGARRGGLRDAVAGERAGLLTLLAVVVIFGAHSAVDWTWFVPGTAVPALFCAGWLAGRGPLNQRLGPWRARPALRQRPGLAAGVVAIIALALLVGWAVWQPLRAADADNAAVSALSNGNVRAAFADVHAAAAADQVAVEPLWNLAAVYSATGNEHAAHAALVKAIGLQPQNPATWRQLGFYDLQHGQPHKAVGVLLQSLKLAGRDVPTLTAYQQAVAEVQKRSPVG
jgi:cytochrome c-type biogenesis protein CcmH/NrfG